MHVLQEAAAEFDSWLSIKSKNLVNVLDLGLIDFILSVAYFDSMRHYKTFCMNIFFKIGSFLRYFTTNFSLFP